MNKVMIQLDILEPVVVDFESKEGYVEVGNFNNCIKPQWDGTNFIDIETEEEKAIRLASVPKISQPLTAEQLIDVLKYNGIEVWPL